MWERAQKIAKAMLDGQLWLPEVDKSTHYHAYWVRPSWVNEMKKMYKTGVHTFYRPRAWGDGSDAPSWGTPGRNRGDLRQARRSRAKLGRAGERETVRRPCDAYDAGRPALTPTKLLSLPSPILQGCPAAKIFLRAPWDFHANALTHRNVSPARSGPAMVQGKHMAVTTGDISPSSGAWHAGGRRW